MANSKSSEDSVEFSVRQTRPAVTERPTGRSTAVTSGNREHGRVPSIEETGRSHKESCQVYTEDVPRLPNATVAIHWLNYVPHDNKCCHTTVY
ncbi:hypothetical protein AVEN_225907-1 [Araneus ventricosus]|uniref:Uncharacterized protein n=1 Tax=Araneus ventricosus TaxID=182803 RepID=A0A4Y2BDF0_ARAVE|nr:hypothetical protein AVEN_225907-1 [Araneus ventricosus]